MIISFPGVSIYKVTRFLEVRRQDERKTVRFLNVWWRPCQGGVLDIQTFISTTLCVVRSCVFDMLWALENSATPPREYLMSLVISEKFDFFQPMVRTEPNRQKTLRIGLHFHFCDRFRDSPSGREVTGGFLYFCICGLLVVKIVKSYAH